LLAEHSAAFLCAEPAFTNTPRFDHAQYIAHWLEVLKWDNKAVFSAASPAASAGIGTRQSTHRQVICHPGNPCG
jgi:antirestriction protein ArdC